MAEDTTISRRAEQAAATRVCVVTERYESAYPDPLVVHQGEVLTVMDKETEWPGWIWCVAVSGKAGWVPAAYVERDGPRCQVLVDHESTELSVHAGERLDVERMESGWIWCVNTRGQRGWVPVSHVEFRRLEDIDAPRPRHVLTILAVEDLARARSFYADAFRWAVRVDVPVYVELELPDGRGLGLYLREAFARNTGQAPARVDEERISATEIYLRCDDLEPALARARAAGARLLSAPAVRDWGDEAAYVRDPDGNVIVLARPVRDPTVEEVVEGRGSLCRRVLAALPDWFGIPEAVERYVRDVDRLPTYAVLSGGERVGFVSLKVHTEYAAEIYVIGIMPSHHRRGLGRRLVRAAEAHARRRDLRLLTVKTLSPARESAEYSRTRAFYAAIGFVPVEELPALWGDANPCLLMAKPI